MSVSPIQIADMFSLLEKQDIRVSNIVMNPETWQRIEAWGDLVAYVSYADKPRLWGANVWVKEGLPADFVKVYGEGDPKFGIDWPEFKTTKAGK